MKRHLVYLTALLLVLLTACGGSGNTASDAGEMEGHPALEKAYQAGKSIR